MGWRRSGDTGNGGGALKSMILLFFWRAAFSIAKRRRGVTCFHATLARGADTKTAKGRADLYRDFTRVINRKDKGRTMVTDDDMAQGTAVPL